MAKIPRKIAKIFGDNAGFQEISVFGTLQNGAPAYSTDLDIIQSLPNWGKAWKGAVIASNSPAIEDMNGFCLVVTQQIAYILQTGIPEWHPAQEYRIGNIVNIPAVGFTTATANATQGAVYSNNSQTFTVLT